ncbi:MAG: hypothetical protein AB7I27_00035 [Bacteriovoracaceae bacterium]
MSSNNHFRNYKHDIPGKFKDITLAVSSMSAEGFDNKEYDEVLMAIHEVLLKMLSTSQKTIKECTKAKVSLQLVSKLPLSTTPIEVFGIKINYQNSNNEIIYFLEDSSEIEVLKSRISLLRAILPIQSIIDEKGRELE